MQTATAAVIPLEPKMLTEEEKTQQHLKRAYPKFTSDVERITPEVANEWLTNKNPRNRQIVPAHVAEIARQMTAGLWVMNGQPICFDWDGHLLNGQHRLAAIVKCGVPQDVCIQRGLDPDAFLTIDIGKNRTMRDHLFIADVHRETDLATLAAAARIVANFDQKTGVYQYSKGKMNPEEMLEFVKANPMLSEIIGSLPANANRVCSRAIVGAMKYLFWRIHEGQADAFIDSLCSGVGLQEGSPILALRNRITQMIQERIPLGSTTVRRQIVAYFVYAWRAYREGRSMTTMQYRPDYEICLSELV